MSEIANSYLNLGGTIRSQPALTTINTLTPIMQEAGITRVANITGLDCIGIPVAVCIRPGSKHLSVSQGKGITWELAVISAVMESLEGYHAEHAPTPVAIGSYQELMLNYPVISPLLFAQGPLKLSYLEQCSMGWTPAVELIKNQSVLIPHALTCLDSTKAHPEYSFFRVSSNGLAAGNILEEAMCHAFYEIIERDALTQWAVYSDAKRKLTQIKLDTIHSSMNQALLTQLHSASQYVKIWDITSSLKIPSYHCVITDTHPFRQLGQFRGTGTHLLKEVALSRAITEAAQSRLTLITGSRDDVFSDHYYQKNDGVRLGNLDEGQYHFDASYQPPIEASFSENIHYLIKTLSDNYFNQIFMVNHTHPRWKIPVVQLFIPGMKFNGK